MIRRLTALAFPWGLVVACTPGSPSFVGSLSQVQPILTYDECKEAQICTVRGDIKVVESDGVAMGELTLEGGKCITLSLSQNDIKYVRRIGSIDATVSGRVYSGHHDPNYILLKIEGRKVGYPRCGDFYVFVP